MEGHFGVGRIYRTLERKSSLSGKRQAASQQSLIGGLAPEDPQAEGKMRERAYTRQKRNDREN